jgi:hypothetical protein
MRRPFHHVRHPFILGVGLVIPAGGRDDFAAACISGRRNVRIQRRSA